MLPTLFSFDKLLASISVTHGTGKALSLLRTIFLRKALRSPGRGGLPLSWVFFFLIVIFLPARYTLTDRSWCSALFGFAGRAFWTAVVEKGAAVLGAKTGTTTPLEAPATDGRPRHLRQLLADIFAGFIL